VDLIFPYHENEFAQSECATGKPFARYWMHNGHINVDNRKMSKSLGNFLLVRDISKEFDLEVVRMFMLSAHYRSPINYSHDLLVQAQNALDRMYTARNNAVFAREHAKDKPMSEEEQAFAERSKAAIQAFDDAMGDDLNTADAIGVIFEYIRDMNTVLADANDPSLAAFDTALGTLTCMTDVLGLLRREADTVPAEIKELVDERTRAKKEKDYARADELRQKVLEMGYVIEDTPKGAKVKKA
jgi:cysteinyl-tRNA synthetase